MRFPFILATALCLSACANDEIISTAKSGVNDPVVSQAMDRASAAVVRCENQEFSKWKNPTLSNIMTISEAVADKCSGIAQAEAKKLKRLHADPEVIAGACDYLTSRSEAVDRIMNGFIRKDTRKAIARWDDELQRERESKGVGVSSSVDPLQKEREQIRLERSEHQYREEIEQQRQEIKRMESEAADREHEMDVKEWELRKAKSGW